MVTFGHIMYPFYRLLKYGRKCFGKVGPDMTICQLKRYKALIRELEKARSKCSKTSDPEKCKSKIDKKYQKIKII